MIEKTFVKRSGPKYWAWIILLLALIVIGFAAYIYQMTVGFQVTGMSRGVSTSATSPSLSGSPPGAS